MKDLVPALLTMVLSTIGVLLPANDALSLTLVRDGEALCTIVTGDDDQLGEVLTMKNTDRHYALPPDAISDAAQDLADHFAQMAGIWNPQAYVPVVERVDQAAPGPRILLGTAAIEAYGLEDEAAALPYPGYIYRVVGDDLLIFGSSSKGTANGVYGFLQDELDIRWFGPQTLFHVVPDQPTIEIDDALDKQVVPSIPGRWFGIDTRIEHPSYRWGSRFMRMNERFDTNAPFINASHNIHHIFALDRYADEHPEYYAMHNGKRQSEGSRNHIAVCYSNPTVIDIATRAARNFFRKNDRANSFSLGISDSNAYCECDQCAALQPNRSYRGRRVASDMYFHFVNEVARRVAEEFPDRYIGVIAYNDVTDPPLDEVADNVHVVLVNDVSEHFDADYAQQDDALVRAWQDKGITLGLYYYTSLAKLVPAYFPRHLARELKDKHARGFTSLRCEANPAWPWHGPMVYLQTRLSWDITLDTDELLDEYFQKLYGPAAEPMQQLYDLFETIHMRPRNGGFLYEHYKYQQFRPYTAEDLETMRRLLQEAHAAFETLSTGYSGRENKAAQRVAYVSNGLKVFLQMLEGKVLAEQLAQRQSISLDTTEMIDQLVAVERLGDILRRHKTLYRETIVSDRFMARRFTNDTATPVRMQWNSHVSAVIVPALARLHAWSREQGTQRLRERVAGVVEQQLDNPYKRALFMLESGRATLGRNLVSNHGFETVTEDGSAEGWSRKVGVEDRGGRIDTVPHPEPDAQFGNRAGRIQAVREQAYYLVSARRITPGEAYLCEAQAKLVTPEEARIESKARVYMLVRWFGDDGWIRTDDYLSDDVDEINDWVRLQTVAVPPTNAHTLRLFLFVENMREDEQALFDNVNVRLVEEKGTP